MGKVFTLTDSVKSIITDALDDLITELGKPCRLVYPPRWVSCQNCLPDPIGRKSSNIWKTGGPLPFSNGSICPLCDGVGRRASEASEVVQMLCAWEPKSFFYPLPGVDLRVPYGIVQTKFYLTDLPKVEQCDHMIFQIAIEGIAKRPYKLLGEPGDRSNIIQGRYATASWERAG